MAAKLVSVIAGALAIPLIYGIGRRCFDSRRTGLIAATLAALSPLLINANYSPGSDMLATTFFLASIYFVARYDGQWKWLVFAGVMGGLAFHTRYVMISFVPAVILYFGVALRGTWRERLLRTGICLAAFAVVIAPWTAVYMARHGRFPIYDHSYLMMAAIDNEGSWLNHMRAPRVGGLLAVLESFPTEIARNWAKNAAYFPLKILIPTTTLTGALVIVGLPQLFKKMNAPRLFFFLQGIFLLAVTFLTLLKYRFFIPAIPLALVAGAYILAECLPFRIGDIWPENLVGADRLRRIPFRNAVTAVCVVFAALLSLARVPRDFAERNNDDMKRAGLAIGVLTDLNAPVITTHMTLAWYAGRPYIPMAAIAGADLESLDERIRQVGGRVLVFSRKHGMWDFPQLEPLLHPGGKRIPRSLQLIYADTSCETQVVAYLILGPTGVGNYVLPDQIIPTDTTPPQDPATGRTPAVPMMPEDPAETKDPHEDFMHENDENTIFGELDSAAWRMPGTKTNTKKHDRGAE